MHYSYDTHGNWQEVLTIVCEELIKKCPDKFRNFDKNDIFKGRERNYFSYKPEELRKARKLSNGLYVETNLSANSIARLCCNILEQCGYNYDDLKFKIEYKRKDRKRQTLADSTKIYQASYRLTIYQKHWRFQS